jgi:single-strand selective monofunctional uracil DNA glycosylase
MPAKISEALLSAAKTLRSELDSLRFEPPVSHVYNPLDYAWDPYEQYISRYADARKTVVFLGMNPGPFGMAQTGVPFGDVTAARDWLGISGKVGSPKKPHPKRAVKGFACPRGEVSGRRLWGLFRARFEQPAAFFKEHMVLNYCPLAFMEQSGRNLTPDKLPAAQRDRLFGACNIHLRSAIEVLRPAWVVGIGGFAFNRATEALPAGQVKIVQILHPSPACPASNADWAGTVTRQLQSFGIWPP